MFAQVRLTGGVEGMESLLVTVLVTAARRVTSPHHLVTGAVVTDREVVAQLPSHNLTLEKAERGYEEYPPHGEQQR